MKRGALAALIGLVALSALIRLGPLPPGLLDDEGAQSTVVVDRTGILLYEALSQDGTRASALTADQLPPLLVAATLAAEDRRFWSHPGIDPLAMLRALRINLAERRIVEGGSTISQQVAKLLLNRQAPDRVRGWRAKIYESILALRLEHRLTKQEMLALYLNHAGYGNQLVGVERASRVYFGVSARRLTAAQAAFLAGLPQRPSRFNPYRSLDLAISRQRTVLARMVAAGALSAEAAQQARDERLTFAPAARPFDAPHFVEMVLAQIGEPRPTRIETTLDLELQRSVGGIIDSYRTQLTRHGAHNVAVVVLDNASGEWLAWEGSGDYDDAAHGGRLNGPTLPRQPGSALKPFTYAVAFEHGYHPASVLADVPTHFPTAEAGVVYTPRNYDGGYRGPMLAREALAGSQNIPAVVLASDVGVPALVRTLSRAGVSTFDKTAAYYGLGLTLGNAEVRLDELVAAYAAFARGGLWVRPTSLAGTSCRTAEGARVYSVFSPQTAFWITDILSDAEAREAVFGRGGDLEFPFPVAVKTGTSQAYHDNWTVGYSRHVTVGVWVGNFDRTPLRNSSGVTGAAPIFHAVMLAAERRVGGSVEFSSKAIVERPASLASTEVCTLSGLPANAWCPTRRSEWLPTERTSVRCDWHRRSGEGVLVDWPPAFREWSMARDEATSIADRERHTPRAKPASTRKSAVRAAALAIVNPPDGATYSIDPTLRREFQTLPLRVAAPEPGPIQWFVDGVSAGSSASDRALPWPLLPGLHRIMARDASGRSAQSTIEVR
jgi:penicillin-binding protein 1C